LIILRNYSKINTCIQIDKLRYTVVEKTGDIRQGVGGFSEDGELLGLYIDDGKLYFRYNNKTCFKFYQKRPKNSWKGYVNIV